VTLSKYFVTVAHFNIGKCCVYLLTGGTSPVNCLNVDDVQSLAADDRISSLSDPSNVTRHPADVGTAAVSDHAASSLLDVSVPEEFDDLNDHSEDNDQSLVLEILECNSVSEFTTELPVSTGENVRLSGSMSLNRGRGRPKSKRMASSSVPVMMDYELTSRLKHKVQPVRQDCGKKSVLRIHEGKHKRSSIRVQDRIVKKPNSDVRVHCKSCKSILTKQTAYKCVRCTSHLAQTSMKRGNSQRLTTASKCLRNLSKYRSCERCGYHLLISAGGCRRCGNVKTSSAGSSAATSNHVASASCPSQLSLCECLFSKDTDGQHCRRHTEFDST